MKNKLQGSRGYLVAWLIFGMMMVLPRIGSGASPLSGQQTGERLDRRKGDRQLQARLETPRLHQQLRTEMMQPQVRPPLRVREWDEDLTPRRRRVEDPIVRRRRRIGLTID